MSLISNQRKSLIEKIALRWHSEGIEALKKYGNFKKYTPLFHFIISEPFNLEENFIFITELFGNERLKEFIPPTFEGARIQYHGNYNGCQRIVLTGISNSHILPYDYINAIGKKDKKTMDSPSYQLIKPTKEDLIAFDNSLEYLENETKWDFPKTFHLGSNGEFFSSTINF
jgi:hypothetical protein